jgi:hypothetical protein
MRRNEIKAEINKIIENVSDETLEKIHTMEEHSNNNTDSIRLSHHLKRIFSEDKGLLERLAK